MINFYSFVLALATSFFLMPFIIRIATKFNLIDKPGERKVHLLAVPRVGGIAVVISFIFAVFLLGPSGSPILKGIVAGAIIVAMVGLLDDYSSLNPYIKFVGQIIAASVALIISGLSISQIDIFGLYKIELGFLSYPFTILWIIGITNAVNLMDGLDGLAAGIVSIALFFLGLIGFLQGHFILVFICATLLGSTLGFLKYNAHPASVFMGDVGSYFLGFILSMLTLVGAFKSAAVMALALPITILGLPILDTVWAFSRRILSGKNPFSPDKLHIHHRLMGLGLGHGLTVMFMYGIATFLGMVAVLSVYQYQFKEMSLLIVGVSMVFAAFKLVTYVRNRPTLKSLFKSKISPVPVSVFFSLRLTLFLPLIIRNLIIVALLLNIVVLTHTNSEGVIIGIVLVSGLVYLYLTSKSSWYEQFMMFILFLSGAYIIFTAEQVIDPVFLGNISAEVFSNVLYSLIGILILMNIVIKRLSGNFLSNPFEFFILLFVISLNILPPLIVQEYHLAAVSIKSIILFLGYRLLLEYHLQRSRRIVYVSFGVILFTITYSLYLMWIVS